MRIDLTQSPVIRVDIVKPEPTSIDVVHRRVEVTVIDMEA